MPPSPGELERTELRDLVVGAVAEGGREAIDDRGVDRRPPQRFQARPQDRLVDHTAHDNHRFRRR